jgi:CRP-like cAMP-binding protein
VVLQKGDIGREMFVILTGKVEILDSLEDDREILAELGPGDIFGEMAIFDKVRTRSAYAVASERSQVLEFNADTLNKFFEHEIPKRFLVNIIGLLCHRLRTTDDMYISARCQKI